MQSLKRTPPPPPPPNPASPASSARQSAVENDSRCFQARESPIDHAADPIVKEASVFTVSRNRVTLPVWYCHSNHAYTTETRSLNSSLRNCKQTRRLADGERSFQRGVQGRIQISARRRRSLFAERC